MHAFCHSCNHSATRLFILELGHSFIRKSLYSSIHSVIERVMHTITDSFIQFIHSFIHPSILYQIIDSFIHPSDHPFTFMHHQIHSLIDPGLSRKDGCYTCCGGEDNGVGPWSPTPLATWRPNAVPRGATATARKGTDRACKCKEWQVPQTRLRGQGHRARRGTGPWTIYYWLMAPGSAPRATRHGLSWRCLAEVRFGSIAL